MHKNQVRLPVRVVAVVAFPAFSPEWIYDGRSSLPSRHRSGGLWLMWSDDIDITVHTTSFHLILAIATIRATNQKFGLVCIYGDPYHRQTSLIWNQITSFVYNNATLPMLCMGDMNDLLYDIDKSTPVTNRFRMNAFQSFVKSCGLFDLGYSGPAYTWTNKRFSSKPVYERLDRCLVNADWCTLFPISNVYNLPLMHTISDHAPILLSTDGTISRTKRTFKFENWWLKEDDFNQHAKGIWAKTTSKPFSQRTNHLAQALRIWCRKKKPLQQELNEIEDQIKEIQERQLPDQDHVLESSLVTRYEQNLTKLTDSYM